MSLNLALAILILIHLVAIIWHLHLRRQRGVDIWPIATKDARYSSYPIILMEPGEGRQRYIICHPQDAPLLRLFMRDCENPVPIYENENLRPQKVTVGG